MSVKRDCGSFARASRKLLAPLVSPLGYQDDGAGFFCRRRSGRIEGFALGGPVRFTSPPPQASIATSSARAYDGRPARRKPP